MRILHVFGKLDRGGAETWLVQVMRHIDRSKYQFDFLVHTEEPGAYDQEVKSMGARIIPCLSPSNPVRYARNFLRVLREYGPYDCVHSHVHHFSGYILMLARCARVPIRIAHSHSDTRVGQVHAGFGRRAYFRAMVELLNMNATSGLAPSARAAAALFGSGWEADQRWSVCHYGIELDPFTHPYDSEMIRASLGIQPGSLVVGHVGRFCDAKNHEFLVEIAREVCTIHPDSVFLLVGDGPLRREIEGRVAATGLKKNVVFAGVRSDIPALMKGAMDVFLFPSTFEGLGIVVIEAQAAGLNSVISDVIPAEADVIPCAILRLPLSSSARRWAEAVLRTAALQKPTALNPALGHYSIPAAVSRLASVYDRQLRIALSRADLACARGE